jgi:hypothetical protein
VFVTVAPLVEADRSTIQDVYVLDLDTHEYTLESLGVSGVPANASSLSADISGEGRYVAFVSEASNPIGTSVRGTTQVYVHDLSTGLTELVSRKLNGQPGLCHDKCQTGELDINLMWDVFVHDRSTRRTLRASTDDGEEWMENSSAPSLDGSGRVLLFGSQHPVHAGDTDYDEDLFIRLVTEVSPVFLLDGSPIWIREP